MCLFTTEGKWKKKVNQHPEEWLEGDPVKRTQIFIGCHLRFFRVASTRIFFQGGSLKKVSRHTYKSEKNQVAPSKFLSRFYRVPFKSLLRVQIKRVSNDPFLWYFENNFGPLPKTTWPLSILQKNLWHCQVSAWLIITIAILNVFITDQCSVVSCYQRFVPSIGNVEKTIWVFNYFGRPGLFGGTENFFNFSKVFFYVFMGRTSTKFKFLYILVSTLKIGVKWKWKRGWYWLFCVKIG